MVPGKVAWEASTFRKRMNSQPHLLLSVSHLFHKSPGFIGLCVQHRWDISLNQHWKCHTFGIVFSWLVFTPMNDWKQQPQRNWEDGSRYLCEHLFCRVQWGNLETFPWPHPVLTGVCGAQHNTWLYHYVFHIKKHFSSLKGGVWGSPAPAKWNWGVPSQKTITKRSSSL